MEFFKELLLFLKERKRLWMTPLILILLLFGVLIVTLEGSVLAPFIYSFF